jgi:hypothetical protein
METDYVTVEVGEAVEMSDNPNDDPNNASQDAAVAQRNDDANDGAPVHDGGIFNSVPVSGKLPVAEENPEEEADRIIAEVRFSPVFSCCEPLLNLTTPLHTQAEEAGERVDGSGDPSRGKVREQPLSLLPACTDGLSKGLQLVYQPRCAARTVQGVGDPGPRVC